MQLPETWDAVAPGYADEARKYSEHYARGTPPCPAMMQKKLGPAAWAEVHRKLLEALRARLPAAGADLAAEALLTRGTRSA